MNQIKNRSARDQAKEEIREYLEDTILDHLSRGESPVAGKPKKFRGLSKDYIAVKRKISGSTKPNMELYGDMLDDFDVRVEGSTLSFGIHSDASDESKLKAENHNKFTARARKTKVPERSWIPKKGENLRRDIMRDINAIIQSHAEELDAD